MLGTIGKNYAKTNIIMLDQHTRTLIIKDLSGTISPEEKAELNAWVDASPDNRRFMETYVNREQALAAMAALTAMDNRRILQKIEEGISEQEVYKMPYRTRMRPYIRAAIFLLVVAGVWYFWLHRKGEEAADPAAVVAMRLARSRQDREKPVVITGKHQLLALEDIPVNGTVEKDGVRVTRTGSRSVSVETTTESSNVDFRVEKAVISVPYGQSWQISLPGVADVDIGPGTSLALMPAKGEGTDLVLDGEAYFEVVHDPRSVFSVSTPHMRTEVLGTAFDIDSNDSLSTAVLVSGSVKVKRGRQSRILRPGNEARVGINKGGIDVVEDVDMDTRLAWRNPSFKFDNVNLRQFMQQVTRWYGLKGTVFDRRVDTMTRGLLGGGHVRKELTLPELLNLLKKEDHLLFEVRDKIIYVSPDLSTSSIVNDPRA
jgi:ferric-dicitrate binding protein FerR (iron transport regulator)